MIADLHVHTEFSCDSEADMEQYIKQAIEKKMHMICFTDHVDLNRNGYGYNYYMPDRFFDKFNQMKEKYRSYINVYAGIEFGEPHLYADKLKQLSSFPCDYIIGIPHWNGTKLMELPSDGDEIKLVDGQAVYVEDDCISLI